jgi:hypothetical protein
VDPVSRVEDLGLTVSWEEGSREDIFAGTPAISCVGQIFSKGRG